MIYLIVALPAEARGLAKGLGLRQERDAKESRQIYRGAGVKLVVSGPGRHRAARAVDSIAEQVESRRLQGWLNVGIAGHPDLAPGTCLLADEIQGSTTEQSWWPTIPFQSNCLRASVRTVDRPETDFAVRAAYDMEAAGFFAAASRIATPGLVQVLKVVSDNPGDDLECLTASRVETLMLDACSSIADLLGQLEAHGVSVRSRRLKEESR